MELNKRYLLESGKATDADKLDGLNSTDFLRSTGKAADADKLDGKDSSAFLLVTGKAADSNKLDGKDSTAFLEVGDTAFDSDRLGGYGLSNFVRQGQSFTGTAADADKLGGHIASVYLREYHHVDQGEVSVGSYLATDANSIVKILDTVRVSFNLSCFGTLVSGDVVATVPSKFLPPAELHPTNGKLVVYGLHSYRATGSPSAYAFYLDLDLTTGEITTRETIPSSMTIMYEFSYKIA